MDAAGYRQGPRGGGRVVNASRDVADFADRLIRQVAAQAPPQKPTSAKPLSRYRRSSKAARLSVDLVIDNLRERRVVDRDLLARVLSLCAVGKPDECWNWAGGLSSGYGRIRIGGRLALSHRAVAYAVGIVEDVFDPDRVSCVLHSCDNPACCNPRHLTAGTLSDNMQDCSCKGRLHVQRQAAPRLRMKYNP